jgi:crotonobetainyl-CoA:carnitine CoA-transferase CaiB-like acyl-CoA transferase
MAEAVLAHNVFALQALHGSGSTSLRGEDMLTGGVPAYGVYVTSDARFVAVGALEDKFWRLLCATLGREDLAPFGLARGDAGERVRADLARIFAAQPLAHWSATFERIDCCVTPVHTLAEALSDPQFTARGMLRNASDGAPYFAPPFRMPGCNGDLERDAPRQGEHSIELLREAGYDDATIAALQSTGALGVR